MIFIKVHLLPHLLYVEPSYKYILYSFVPGSTDYVRKNKKEMLISLVRFFINDYKPVPDSKGWGWAEDTINSWQEFLLSQVLGAREDLHSIIDKQETDLVIELVKMHK